MEGGNWSGIVNTGEPPYGRARHLNQNDSIDRRWTQLYPAGIGPALQVGEPHLLAALDSAAARRPEAALFHYFDRKISFAHFVSESDALAVCFADHGVNAGDRVAIVMQTIPAFAVATIAAWRLGAIPVPINPMYRAAELGRILADAQPTLIICQDIEQAEVRAALKVCGQAIRVLAARPASGTGGHTNVPAGVAIAPECDLDAAIARYAGRRPPPRTPVPAETGLILYTSGTTGQPKGAMLSHAALAYNAAFTQQWCGLEESDCILGIAPLFHITGFVCHLGAAVASGAALIMSYRFEPNLALDMIRRWRPAFTIGVITAFNALMRVPSIRAEDMACFRAVFSGGAPIPPALQQEIAAALGVRIAPCYGMTETAAPAIFTPPDVPAPNIDGSLAIGLPIPGVDVRIVDDNGAALPPFEHGEVLMRGPQIMQGYWRKPEETAAALCNGWLHSGDVGFMDAQGWVYLVDRKKDVIIASGFKVWPREVEDALYAFAGIREVAVVGIDDAYRGQTVKAFVSLVEGTTLDLAALQAHCRALLAAYKVPREIEVLAELPRTVTGKILRSALR